MHAYYTMNTKTRESLKRKALNFDDVLENKLKELTVSKPLVLKHAPYVTTITISVKLDKQLSDVKTLLQAYNACMKMDSLSKASKDSKGVNTELEPHLGELKEFIDMVYGGSDNFFPKTAKNLSFQNCVVFSVCNLQSDDKSTVSVKCFTNGSLHITGIKNVSLALSLAESFCTLYDVVFGQLFSIDSYDVQLINSHFSLNLGEGAFDLTKLFAATIKETQHLCMYNNERHAGVIIKLLTETCSQVTVIVFDTGNILVCAFHNVDEFVLAWDFITSFLASHWHSVFTLENLTKTRTAKRVNRNTFDYGQYIVLK